MKVKILYHELREKEFRSKNTLKKFINKKLPSEILRVVEYKKSGISYWLDLLDFFRKNRDE